MPIVPYQYDLQPFSLAVPLSRYAQIIRMPECAFWGVTRDEDHMAYNVDADTIVLAPGERAQISRQLAHAQQKIERSVRYPLTPSWIEAEQRPYECPINANLRKIIEPGIRAEDDVELVSVVDHTNDPAVVGPIASGLTAANEDEIRVYRAGTEVEVDPSSVAIDGAGNITIEIPRCRLVTQVAYDGGRPIAYGTVGNFEATVDVKREYNDPATQASLVWVGSRCVDAACSEETVTACLKVLDAEAGIVRVDPATYSAGVWTTQGTGHTYGPSFARLYYRAGIVDGGARWEAQQTIIRLAHALMPHEPCGCSVIKQAWERDRAVPDVLSRERLNCPWGLENGSWEAWRFAMTMREIEAFVW